MGIFNFMQPDVNLTVWLIFEGKEYELNQFNISFGQSVDHKGQPQDEVRGGRMVLGFSEILPENMYRWAMKSEAKNGEIVFRSETASAPLKIEFKNTYCVNFVRNVTNNGGINTAIHLTPDEVNINGINFDNHWVE